MIKLLIIVFSLALGWVALSRLLTARVEDYANTKPVFDIRDYFNGEIRAWGMVLDWRGRIKKRFTVTMQARWNGNRGEMEESFLFDDGSTQHRTWMLEVLGSNRFTGRAGDVVGVAQGKQFGHAVQLQYVLRMPIDGKSYDIHIDDWLYLQPDGVVLNESRMKVYGLPVGKIITSFAKP